MTYKQIDSKIALHLLVLIPPLLLVNGGHARAAPAGSDTHPGYIPDISRMGVLWEVLFLTGWGGLGVILRAHPQR